MRVDLYEDLFIKEDTYWWHVNKREAVLSMLQTRWNERLHNASILEVGCGTGAMLQRWKALGTPIGVDTAPEALALCRRRGLRHLCLANAMASLPFREASFDVISLLDVLEHLEDDVQALIELCRLLKPHGWIVLSVPAYRWMASYWDEALGHKRRYSRSELRTTVETAGLIVERLSYTNFFILPAAAVARRLKSLMGKNSSSAPSDFVIVPPIANVGLLMLVWIEYHLIQCSDLPCGLSILCLARKTV